MPNPPLFLGFVEDLEGAPRSLDPLSRIHRRDVMQLVDVYPVGPQVLQACLQLLLHLLPRTTARLRREDDLLPDVLEAFPILSSLTVYPRAVS